jgi:hypothetical protein
MSRRRRDRRLLVATGCGSTAALSEALKVAAGYSQAPTSVQIWLLAAVALASGVIAWLSTPQKKRAQSARLQIAN